MFVHYKIMDFEIVEMEDDFYSLAMRLYELQDMKGLEEAFKVEVDGEQRNNVIFSISQEYEHSGGDIEKLMGLIDYISNKEDKKTAIINFVDSTINNDEESCFEFVLKFINSQVKNKKDRLEILRHSMIEAIRLDKMYCFEMIIDNIKLNDRRYFDRNKNKIENGLIEDAVYNESHEMIKAMGPYILKPINKDLIVYSIELGLFELSKSLLDIDCDDNELVDFVSSAIEHGKKDVVEFLAPKIDKHGKKDILYERISEGFDRDIFNILVKQDCIDINENAGCLLEVMVELNITSNEDVEYVVGHAKKESREINTKIMIQVMENYCFELLDVMMKNLEFDNKEILEFMENEEIFDRENMQVEEVKIFYDTLKSRMEKDSLNKEIGRAKKAKRKIKAF